jgi:type IV secretion system protein VirD4
MPAGYARWLRLMVSQSLQDMARVSAPASAPVLYPLDEFAALGHLAPVERAMSMMAGYGIQLWPILQDLHQLHSRYGECADTFLSNVSVLQIFGVNDHDGTRLTSAFLDQGNSMRGKTGGRHQFRRLRRRNHSIMICG